MQTPNQLSQVAVAAFKSAYQEEFSMVLTDDEVRKIAERLLRYFGILNGKNAEA